MSIKFLTLGDLRRALTTIPDTPEFNNLPLIYSTDDEGNEYNAVNFLPSIVNIKKMKDRFIHLLEDDEKSSVKAVIIN